MDATPPDSHVSSAPALVTETPPAPTSRRARTALVVVRRDALLDLVTASPARVVAVVAPPGYGKTTLLAQWAEQLGADAVTFTCRHDTDAATLTSTLAGSLTGPPRTLLVDEVQALTDVAGLEALADLVDRLPPAWRVGLASRCRLPL